MFREQKSVSRESGECWASSGVWLKNSPYLWCNRKENTECEVNN